MAIFAKLLCLQLVLLANWTVSGQANLMLPNGESMVSSSMDAHEYIRQIRHRAMQQYLLKNNYTRLEDVPDRIIGGVDAMQGEAPFQMQLFLRNGNQISFTCGGSLISSRTILTAGHCVNALAEYRIRYGSNSRLFSPYPLAEVSAIRLHPQFNLQAITNDVALFILRNPVQPSSNVRAIELLPTAPQAGTIMTLYGFGLMNGVDQSSLAINLQKAQLQLVSEQDCANFISSVGLTKTPGHICAAAANRASCNGDSGGPLIVSQSGLQAGIVSFGLTQCPPGAIDVYTNVAYYYNWIRANMEADQPSQNCAWVCQN